MGHRQRTHHPQLKGNLFGKPTERNQPRTVATCGLSAMALEIMFPSGMWQPPGNAPTWATPASKGTAWSFDVLRYCQKHGGGIVTARFGWPNSSSSWPAPFQASSDSGHQIEESTTDSGALRAETVELQVVALHGETRLFADELFEHRKIAIGARHRLPAQPADQHMAMAGP